MARRLFVGAVAVGLVLVIGIPWLVGTDALQRMEGDGGSIDPLLWHLWRAVGLFTVVGVIVVLWRGWWPSRRDN